jgi:hypothetical protein
MSISLFEAAHRGVAVSDGAFHLLCEGLRSTYSASKLAYEQSQASRRRHRQFNASHFKRHSISALTGCYIITYHLLTMFIDIDRDENFINLLRLDFHCQISR